MKQKISLQQLLDEDLLEIPTLEYIGELSTLENMSEYKGVGGVYFIGGNVKPLYIGITKDVSRRMFEHRTGKGNKDLFTRLVVGERCPVSIIREPNKPYQEFYESYLIRKYNPPFNSQKIGERYTIKTTDNAHKFVGKPLEYSPNAKDVQKRIIYSNIVTGLKTSTPITMIAKDNGVSRNLIYRIKKDLQQTTATTTK